ncbi:MAG: sugar-binding domain-containing protein [Pseudomonadota bacterium]
MSRVTRTGLQTLSETASLRIRAAWLYFHRDMTQKQIAEELGVSRSTVVRMLDEARNRGEVQIWINEAPNACTELSVRLQETLGLDEAVIVPGAGDADQTAKDVGTALGQFLSEIVANNMTIGVGWGRTLNASLASFRPNRRTNARVISLQGGFLEASTLNPVDVSWQFASKLGASCLLYLAPLVVDSADTKAKLKQHCGLDRLDSAAAAMDLAVISCGDLGVAGSSLSHSFLGDGEYEQLVDQGAICDTLCQFLDVDGRTVDHPIHDRVMAVDLDTISKAQRVILASGGARRAAAIRATIKRTGATVLVTDEAASRALLDDRAA